MSNPKISWTKPASGQDDVFEESAPAKHVKRLFKNIRKEASKKAGTEAERIQNVFFAIFKETGLPSVENAATPKEDAIGLLKFAAEIEHALMIQYLYAAASLKAGDSGGPAPWSKIMLVAAQEMGHLLSVQNLLILLGGDSELHFGRDSIRASNPDNPIPLVLEKVDSSSLTKYIAAEMPAVISDKKLGKRVEKLISDLGGIELHRVGALYAKLFWLFQPDDNPVAPLNLFPDRKLGFTPGWHLSKSDYVESEILKKFQASRQEWVRGSILHFILEQPDDSKSALSLITEISEQGEGLNEKHDSHFFEFVELLDLFEDNQLTISELPSITLPKQSADEPVPAESEYAKLWSDLMDIRYNLLMLDLWHAMSTPTLSPIRKELISLSYKNMTFLRELCDILIMHDKKEAPPSFNLFFEDFPSEDKLRWKRHADLLDKQSVIIDKIRKSLEFQDCSTGECEILDSEGNNFILNIEQSDLLRKSLFPAQIT